MSGIAALVLGAAILALSLSVFWAKQRFGHFERLPQHYGLRGEATSLGTPALIIWQLPVLFILALIGIGGAFAFVPRELQNGDPTIGMIVACVSLSGAHAFILWLTERWARSQHGP